jgi:hypothetical protein
MTSFQFALFTAAVLGLLTILALAALHLLKRLLLLLIDIIAAPLQPAREFRLLNHTATPIPETARPVQSGGTLNRKAL